MVDYIRKSKVREEADMNVGSGVYERLDEEVEYLIGKAEERAEDNGRRTVKARDV